MRMRRSGGGIMPWTFVDGSREFEVPVTGPVIVNDFAGIMVAVRSGLAIGMVAEPVDDEHVERGELDLVLGNFAPSTAGLFLYYPSRKQVMPKLRAFIDYAREYLPDHF